jgi:phage-related protein
VAFDVFAPPKNPAPSSSRPVKPRVNKAQFGDGYSQRSGDGLNASMRTFAAQWPSLLIAHADEIETFFEAHTVKAFVWTLPTESVVRKWTAVDWTRGNARAGVVSLSVNLEEVFDL